MDMKPLWSTNNIASIVAEVILIQWEAIEEASHEASAYRSNRDFSWKAGVGHPWKVGLFRISALVGDI